MLLAEFTVNSFSSFLSNCGLFIRKWIMGCYQNSSFDWLLCLILVVTVKCDVMTVIISVWLMRKPWPMENERWANFGAWCLTILKTIPTAYLSLLLALVFFSFLFCFILFTLFPLAWVSWKFFIRESYDFPFSLFLWESVRIWNRRILSNSCSFVASSNNFNY